MFAYLMMISIKSVCAAKNHVSGAVLTLYQSKMMENNFLLCYIIYYHNLYNICVFININVIYH